MGQFLCVGIVTKMGISKDKINKYDLTLDEINKGIASKHTLSLYNMVETENYFEWEIDHSVLLQELPSFLSYFYPYYYINNPAEYNEVISDIKKCNTSTEIIEIANKKLYECFQMDDMGRFTIHAGKHNIGLYLQYESIIIALQGKILMECYNNMFNFFSKTIQHLVKDFKLAGAISVYITG